MPYSLGIHVSVMNTSVVTLLPSNIIEEGRKHRKEDVPIWKPGCAYRHTTHGNETKYSVSYNSKLKPGKVSK